MHLRQRVKRLTHLIELLRLVRVAELRPRPVNFYTGGEFREGDFEPDSEPGLFDEIAILRIDECAAAERNDGLWRGTEFSQAAPFEVSEMRLAVFAKDFGDGTMFAPLDFFVEIDE